MNGADRRGGESKQKKKSPHSQQSYNTHAKNKKKCTQNIGQNKYENLNKQNGKIIRRRKRKCTRDEYIYTCKWKFSERFFILLNFCRASFYQPGNMQLVGRVISLIITTEIPVQTFFSRKIELSFQQ